MLNFIQEKEQETDMNTNVMGFSEAKRLFHWTCDPTIEQIKKVLARASELGLKISEMGEGESSFVPGDLRITPFHLPDDENFSFTHYGCWWTIQNPESHKRTYVILGAEYWKNNYRPTITAIEVEVEIQLWLHKISFFEK